MPFPPKGVFHLPERRAYPRIAAPVRAFVLREEDRFEVPVRNISRSGLFIFTPKPIAEIGDELALDLQLGDDPPAATVRAEIVHTVPAPEPGSGLLGIGLSFTKLTANQQQQIDRLLGRLMDGSGGGRRAYPRIAHRLDAWCTTTERMRGVLRDISASGVGLWLETPVPLGLRITVEIERDGREPMKLVGKIVSVTTPAADAPFISVGVQFDPMTETQQLELQDFLHALLSRG